MLKEKIAGYIDNIHAIQGIVTCSLISRDGIMLGKYATNEFNEPWFAAMCATLLASAESASTIIKLTKPDVVSVATSGNTLVILGAGEKVIITAVLEESEKDAALKELKELAKVIGEAF